MSRRTQTAPCSMSTSIPGKMLNGIDAVGEQSHKLKATDPRIVRARKIGEVWRSFQAFISSNIAYDEVGIIVAYSGAGSDMEWLWRLTQAPHVPEELPSQLLYYMDPYRILSKWKTCKMHKSKMNSLKLRAVWGHIKGDETLDDAHNSLVDARAQADLLVHENFVSFLDRIESAVTVDKIFKANQLSAMKRDLKPVRLVHKPWQELSQANDVAWEPSPGDDSFCAVGVPLEHGPSSAVQQATRIATCLAILFLFFVPLSIFEQVAEWSNKYAYEDWAEEKCGKDRDGKRKKTPHLVPVKPGARRDKRHRHRVKKKSSPSPPGILCVGWAASSYKALILERENHQLLDCTRTHSMV